jgi:hypothetical protein
VTSYGLKVWRYRRLRAGGAKRSYSLAAISVGVLFWGVGFKVASSFVVEQLGVDRAQPGQVRTEQGRHIHHRHR